jgi:hypothetical protein
MDVVLLVVRRRRELWRPESVEQRAAGVRQRLTGRPRRIPASGSLLHQSACPGPDNCVRFAVAGERVVARRAHRDAVGYDDPRQAFSTQNSWGRGFGDGGYAWPSCEFWNRNVAEVGYLVIHWSMIRFPKGMPLGSTRGSCSAEKLERPSIQR